MTHRPVAYLLAAVLGVTGGLLVGLGIAAVFIT